MASNASWTFSVRTLIKVPAKGSLTIILYDIVGLSSSYSATSCVLSSWANGSLSFVLTTLCEIVYNGNIGEF